MFYRFAVCCFIISPDWAVGLLATEQAYRQTATASQCYPEMKTNNFEGYNIMETSQRIKNG